VVTLNAGGGTFLADGGTTSTLSGAIGGVGSLSKIGAGTLILGGVNTYSGGTSLNGGTVAVNSDGNLGTGALTFDEGTLEALAAGGGITSSKGVTLDAGGGTFLADTGTTSTLSGAISGVGSFTKDGAGTLILSGVNTYSGATNVVAGTLEAGSTTAFSSSSAFIVTSLLDLHGFSNTIGSLSGNGTVTNNGAAPAVLTVANDTTSTTFGGILEDGTGVLGLTKTGTGTLILTGNNAYSGGTTISAGTLQIGTGGTTGSITGNVTDNGSLAFDRSNSLTFNSVISGSGTVIQNGSGTIILGGTNSYTGGTEINNGTLLVNNAQALGLGNVVVNDGVLGADPQPINVRGNYTQNAGGTLQLQVAGANPGQYDSLNVGGNASLGGTLQLISLGFQPKAGNQLTLVTTGGVVSGRFAQFLNPFAAGPGFNTVDLVYGRNSVLLEFLNLIVPVPGPVIVTINFASFALTQNQLAAGTLVDQIQFNPKAADLISFLAAQPAFNLPGALEQISPESLTAFYEISFSNANIQRLNLEGRLDDLRSGSTGFSSNMKVNGAAVNLDGKSSKSTVEQVFQPGPENRWGVWVTGFGDFVNVDSDSNAKGYDFTTGGFTVGVDYRITDQLAIGAMGDYAHTWTSLEPSGDIDVDSGRGGVYATWFSHGIYLNGAIYGGHNSYSSSRSALRGMASGGTGGAEFSTFISGGYDFHCGQLTVGPIAALQYTYVNIDSFSENGSLAPLDIHSQSAESLRTDFGFRAFYPWLIGKVLVEPNLRAAWEHEYKYSALPTTAGFAGIPGPSATFFGPSEGHDSAIVSAGVSVQWTPAIATYVNYDGQLGRSRYDSNAVTGGVRISF
jgi:outer membrane autotransporter protein